MNTKKKRHHQSHSSRESLCFCEYDNLEGERSHLLATFCDCHAVDSLCDNVLTCKSIPEEKIKAFVETIEDRIRVPFCNGRGAQRVKLEITLPIIMFPFFLCIGAFGFYWTFFSIISFIISIHMLGKLCIYKKSNKLFLSFALSSLIQLLLIYLTVVGGFRKVLLEESLLFLTLFGITMYLVYLTKRGPGYVEGGCNPYQRGESVSHDTKQITESEITWVDSRPIEEGVLQLQCSSCGCRRPPRSGHCPVCERCIQGRDHHCAWLDTCIGHHNHLSFFIFLIMAVITGSYGIQLTLTSICTPEIYLNWFLIASDCRFLYSDFPTGLLVSSMAFTLVALLLIASLLVQQILCISQNITGLEWVKARKQGRTTCFGLRAVGNVNNRGFIRNWCDFLRQKRRQKYFDITPL